MTLACVSFVLKPVGSRNLEGVFCGDNFLFVPAMSQLVAELQAAGAYLEKAQNFPGFKEAKATDQRLVWRAAKRFCEYF